MSKISRTLLGITLSAAMFGASPAWAAEPVKLSIASFSPKSSWFAYSTRLSEMLRETLPEEQPIPACLRPASLTSASS